MFKLKLLILFLFAIAYFDLKAQNELNFTTVDTLSYRYYLNSEWENLEYFGIKASNYGYDYYYLNVRTAIASFNLGNYIDAEKYFIKALKNNSYSEFCNEYLFWTYYNLGEKFKANDIYAGLSDETKLKMIYKPVKFWDFAYLEFGEKISNQPDSVAGNVNYINFGLNHNITPNLSLYEAYTFLNQKQNWGTYTQQQLYVKSNINLHKNIVLSLSVLGSDYRSKINFRSEYTNKYSTELYTDTGIYTIDTIYNGFDAWKGKYEQQILVGYIGVSQRINRFKYSLSFHFTAENKISNFTYEYRKYQLNKLSTGQYLLNYTQSDISDTIYNTGDTLQYFYQPGLEFSIFPRTLKNGLEIGCKVYSVIISKKEYYILPIPFINLKFNKYVSVYSEFLHKGNYPFADSQGSLLLNNYNKIKSRITISANFRVNDDLNIFATYLYENTNDNLTNQQYILNSFLVGLKLKFN